MAVLKRSYSLDERAAPYLVRAVATTPPGERGDCRSQGGWVSGCNKRRNRALRDCVTGQLGANRYDRMRGAKAR